MFKITLESVNNLINIHEICFVKKADCLCFFQGGLIFIVLLQIA